MRKRHRVEGEGLSALEGVVDVEVELKLDN